MGEAGATPFEANLTYYYDICRYLSKIIFFVCKNDPAFS